MGGGRADDLSVLFIIAPSAATIASLLYILITLQWGAVAIESIYLKVNIAIYILFNQTEHGAYLTVK